MAYRGRPHVWADGSIFGKARQETTGVLINGVVVCLNDLTQEHLRQLACAPPVTDGLPPIRRARFDRSAPCFRGRDQLMIFCPASDRVQGPGEGR